MRLLRSHSRLYLKMRYIQTSVSSLRSTTGAVELASQLYTTLDNQAIPRFANCRLQLPCIVFTVLQVALRPSQGLETLPTYVVKANGLHDLLITTGDKLPFSEARKMPMWQKLLLVRPWDRSLLELYDSAGPPDFINGSDVLPESPTMEDYQTPPSSPAENNAPVDPEFDSRALQLIVRLSQPFRAILLAQQRGREYNRIAADHDIIARAKKLVSIHDMMDVRTLEIL